MKLDRHSSIPLYAQLRELIMERIQSGEYIAGERIPSEMDFCHELALSRPTVRQAVSELVADGILEIHKGKGTFVAKAPERMIIPHFNALSFSFLNMNSYQDLGLSPIKLLEANRELDDLFRFPDNFKHPGYWLASWPLIIDQQIMGLCNAYIPVQLFPELGQDIATGKRMVDIKANKYASLPQKGSLTLSARPAHNKEASKLEIPRRSYVIVAEGPLFAKSGHVCEVLKICLRPDVIALELN